MRITIDARMMGPQHTRGIGRYIEELVRAMVHVAPEHRYALLVRDPEESPFHGHASVEHVEADVPWYGLAEQVRLPSIIAKTKPDLFHAPHWNVPITCHGGRDRRGVPRVVTIHDLILLEEPLSANVTTRGPVVTAIKRLGYRVALHDALFRSRRILVPTMFVADWIRKRFPSLRTPVDVTGEGMPGGEGGGRWAVGGGTVRKNQPFLLYVGSAYPHKNLDLLVRAWERLAPRHPDLSLVVAGELDAFMSRVKKEVESRNLPRVRFLGRVGEEELSVLYEEATAFVFPSRLEGFGLPPLEALAHGCPVVASRAASLPEVLGEDGAIFFEPSSPDGIVKAVETVLRDPGGVRERVRQVVAALRERHSWRRAAENTLRAYEQAASSRKTRHVA
jgi:glycosyltransferase involved in cell wall biosynthesis